MELMNCGKIGSWCKIQSSHNFENRGVPGECRNRLTVRRWPPGAVSVGWDECVDGVGKLGAVRSI